MHKTALTAALSIALTACGKNDNSNDNMFNIASPADLKADFFTSFIPRIRSKSDIDDVLKDFDFTHRSDVSANDECIRKSIIYSQDADQDGVYHYDSDTLDIRHCYAESEFADYSSISVGFRVVGTAFISTNGQEEGLKGKNYNDVGSSLPNADIFETREFLQTRLVIDGTLRQNDAHEVVEIVTLDQSLDGQPCKHTKAAGEEIIENECHYYTLQTQKVNDVISDQNLSIRGHTADIKAKEYTSKYYDDGVKIDLSIDNWRGQVTYHGPDATPSYSLTDGTDTVSSGE